MRRPQVRTPSLAIAPGPQRVADDPDPDYEARPFLGFGVRANETEPSLWSGDQA
jgi:hypothetical protein